MNLLLESRNDDKHRFFLNFGKASVNRYVLKYFALELITPILMCMFIMDKKQSRGFNQFQNLDKCLKIIQITPK